MKLLLDLSTKTARRLAAAMALAALAVTTGAAAQTLPSPTVNITPHEEAIARKLNLSIGKSIVVDLPRDAKEVFVANPKIANAVVRSTRKIFLIGMADGFTSVFVMDGEGKQIAAFEVTVGRDLANLRQTLKSALAKYNIDVQPAGDSILLTGVVGSAEEAQQATDIANAFVGVSGNLFGSSKGAVINGITIKGKDQVMLRVTVAEISRAVLKQLGVNTTGTWQIGKFATDNPFPISPQELSNTAINATINRGGFSTNVTLNAFERAGVARTLAEPTLTAISGETAKFTAGGEIPIPQNQTCTAVAVGPPQCTTSVTYKPFGITLNFTPVVLAENRISLRVSTDITELDYENQVAIGNVKVVGTKVRKSDTTVEVPSGGSLMTAGLLQQSSRQSINGFPGLMNLPILGALFRSRDYQRQETELMVLVTPYIAKPMDPGNVSRPDDGFVEATDPQSILLGRLNRLYGVAGARPASQGFKGRIGFIND